MWIWPEVKYQRASVYGESSNLSLTLLILHQALGEYRNLNEPSKMATGKPVA